MQQLTVPHRFVTVALLVCSFCAPAQSAEVSRNVQTVLASTQPLQFPRQGRLPLYVLPISNHLKELDDRQTLNILKALDKRGIGYSVDWNHQAFEQSLQEGLRIAKMQRQLGQPVAVNANACLYSFFDGSEETLHVDEDGRRFADSSLGGKLGCPFSLEHRVPVIKERVERFLRGYRDAGIKIEFIFADWEIDGPIEWNDSWAAHQRCTICRQSIDNIGDFRTFQERMREIRSEIQREAFGDNVTRYFPACLVGNYGTYPHDGNRYWYDYFEEEPKADCIPIIADQRAKYREWAHEFDGTGYTFAMPVVYTWYKTFDWYAFDDLDYRWFYNMLLVGSNAGRHTPHAVPSIPFVHWHTTAPPKQPAAHVKQMSSHAYQELLWHLLLRGHDTFFLWCVSPELEKEIKLVHEVYAESLEHADFLTRGTPVHFDVPKSPGSVVSAVRIGNRVLAKRTDFAQADAGVQTVAVSEGRTIEVAAHPGLQVVDVKAATPHAGLIQREGESLFPIGFYEMPSSDEELKEMASAGVNLIRTGSKAALDRAQAVGMMGWMPLGFQEGPTPDFRARVQEVVDHPALAVWEGPDEIIWTFTAYSFLKERAGFTRDDWNAQKRIAVEYSEREANRIMPAMRGAVELIRKLDRHNRPVWINEAVDSDVRFARRYMPFIDITGADYYAVRKTGTDLPSIGRSVDRWLAVGRGKPVWMVLQAFSWHAIKPERGELYPTFQDSRFMAYDAIVHGSKGILYWGSNTIGDPDFRQSLYALTSELSHLQTFLTAQEVAGVEAQLIHDLFDERGIGVRAKLFRAGNEYLLMLVNEDGHHRLGVDVVGLASSLESRELHLLYGDERHRVQEGGFVTRMQPYEVKLFATRKGVFESPRKQGRDYQ